MPDIETLRKYLNLMPDEDAAVAQFAMDAAIAKARASGVKDLSGTEYAPFYDMFIYALAGAWFDNRNTSTPGAATMGGQEAMQSVVNQFVLELRYLRGDADG